MSGVPVEVPAEEIAELSAVEAAEGDPDVAEMRRWANQTPDRYARDAVLAAADAVERAQRASLRVRAEERQWCIDALHEEALRVADVPPDPIRTEAYWAGRVEGVLAAKTLVAQTLATGSAVPVAGDVAIRVADKAAELATVSRVSYREAHTTLMAACGFVSAVPVATPDTSIEEYRNAQPAAFTAPPPESTCWCDSDLVLPHPRGSSGCASAPVATPTEPVCSECGKPRSNDPESEEGMSGMCLRCLLGPLPSEMDSHP